jgi:hypothetical protein
MSKIVLQLNDNLIHKYHWDSHPIHQVEFFSTMYSIYTYTFPLLTWIKSSMRSPRNTPNPQIIPQFNPWSNIVQLFMDPTINLNDACNISTPFSKCPIHGQLLKTSLLSLPFSQPQCGNYVDLVTLIWRHGHIYLSSCWNFILIWYFFVVPYYTQISSS